MLKRASSHADAAGNDSCSDKQTVIYGERSGTQYSQGFGSENRSFARL
jgi:hypothetical protein